MSPDRAPDYWSVAVSFTRLRKTLPCALILGLVLACTNEDARASKVLRSAVEAARDGDSATVAALTTNWDVTAKLLTAARTLPATLEALRVAVPSGRVIQSHDTVVATYHMSQDGQQQHVIVAAIVPYDSLVRLFQVGFPDRHDNFGGADEEKN